MKNSDGTTSAIKPGFFLRTILKCLDNREKRLVYISSLAAIVSNSKELDSEIMAKMNSVLNLADLGIESLKLPAYMSDSIWTDQEVIEEDINYLKEHQTTSQSCLSKIKNIIEHTPKWFRYDSDEVIENDIFKLFCINKDEIYLVTQ